MTVKFDVNLSAWLQNITVEGTSMEDCKEQLLNMSIADLIEANAFERDVQLSDIDCDVVEARATVKVTSVTYNEDDAEEEGIDVSTLPTSFNLTVDYDEIESLESAVSDEIYSEVGIVPTDFDCKVISEE